MPEIIYTARRTVDCIAAKVAEARSTYGVVELECSHCKHQVLGARPMFETATKNAELAGEQLRILCRQCAESQAGLPLEVQDAAAAAGGGQAIITEHTIALGLKPPRGGDA